MNYPQELKYTKDHEWIRDNGDGTATIGITENLRKVNLVILFMLISIQLEKM